MTRFEYKITAYSAKDFHEVIYFCSPEGQCDVEGIPVGQIEKIQAILNKQGLEGWELAHVALGKDGIVVFWKRRLPEEDVIEEEGGYTRAHL